MVSPDAGGVYREGLVGQPVYINPVITNANDIDRDIIALVFGSLEDLSQKISVSSNGTVWTVRLKENLSWHDGVKITSDDIIFTIKEIQNADTHSPLAPTWQGVSIERISELEFKLVTGVPYAFFEDNLKSLYVIPKHLFENIPSANWRLSNYNLEPVGSGPYKFLSYKKEKSGFISEYQLVKNEKYHKDIPYINNVTFSFFTNGEEAVSAFDLAKVDALSGLDSEETTRIKRSGKIVNINLPRYYAVFLNQGNSELLKNKNVRLALTYATPKKKIIDEIFKGYAALVNGPVPFEGSGSSSNLWEFNIELANKILDESSVPKGADGFRGEIKLVVPQIKFLTDTADILKSSWENIGIKTTLILLDPATVNNEVIKTRYYEALIFGNVFVKNPDLLSFWHSSERFYPGLNLSLYNNKTADKLLESIRRNFDKTSREKDISSLQSLIIQDIPAIFLYSPNYIYISSNKVSGLNTSLISSPAERFKSVEKWYVKTKRTLKI